MAKKNKKIKVGIIGVGNCAKSLVEGVQYYAENNKAETGVMKTDIGGYLAGDVEFVVGFDIDERKTGLGLGIFIGKTLLEKNFARITIRNSETRGGAEVKIEWENKNLKKLV